MKGRLLSWQTGSHAMVGQGTHWIWPCWMLCISQGTIPKYYPSSKWSLVSTLFQSVKHLKYADGWYYSFQHGSDQDAYGHFAETPSREAKEGGHVEKIITCQIELKNWAKNHRSLQSNMIHDSHLCTGLGANRCTKDLRVVFEPGWFKPLLFDLQNRSVFKE